MKFEITFRESIACVIVLIALFMILSPLLYNLGYEKGRANVIDMELRNELRDNAACENNLKISHNDQEGLLKDVLTLSEQLDSCKNVLTGGEYLEQLEDSKKPIVHPIDVY